MISSNTLHHLHYIFNIVQTQIRTFFLEWIHNIFGDFINALERNASSTRSKTRSANINEWCYRYCFNNVWSIIKNNKMIICDNTSSRLIEHHTASQMEKSIKRPTNSILSTMMLFVCLWRYISELKYLREITCLSYLWKYGQCDVKDCFWFIQNIFNTYFKREL